MSRTSFPPDRSTVKKVAEITSRVPPTTGFLSVTGSVFYLPKLKMIRIEVLLTKTQSNRGPVPFIRLQEEWTAGRHDLPGMRKRLKREIEMCERRLLTHKWPERKFYLDDCNVSKDPEFVEHVCQNCRCPYCDLSS